MSGHLNYFTAAFPALTASPFTTPCLEKCTIRVWIFTFKIFKRIVYPTFNLMFHHLIMAFLHLFLLSCLFKFSTFTPQRFFRNSANAKRIISFLFYGGVVKKNWDVLWISGRNRIHQFYVYEMLSNSHGKQKYTPLKNSKLCSFPHKKYVKQNLQDFKCPLLETYEITIAIFMSLTVHISRFIRFITCYRG